MIVNMADMLRSAKNEKYGIIAVCPLDLEQISYGFIAARYKKSPVIICCNPALHLHKAENYETSSLEMIGRTFKYYASRYPDVVAALCLDHGDSLEMALRAILAGYTGVMVDKSMYDDETNARILKEVVEVAHAANVGVEAGLGGTAWRDPTPAEIEAHLTKVDAMQKFVKETNVDVVAVSVGGSHGDHKTGQAVLLYDLIKDLNECSNAILCMHGSSQTGDEKLAMGAENGLAKFNVGGDLLIGAVGAFTEYYNEGEYTKERNISNFFDSLKVGYVNRIEEYMDFLGSSNKAKGEN